jgi:hypothetical protein
VGFDDYGAINRDSDLIEQICHLDLLMVRRNDWAAVVGVGSWLAEHQAERAGRKI